MPLGIPSAAAAQAQARGWASAPEFDQPVPVAEGIFWLRLRLPFAGMAGRQFRLVDVMGNEVYQRDGACLVDPGLFIDLAAWRYNVFTLEAVGP